MRLDLGRHTEAVAGFNAVEGNSGHLFVTVTRRTAAREAATPGVGAPHLVDVEEVPSRVLGVRDNGDFLTQLVFRQPPERQMEAAVMH